MRAHIGGRPVGKKKKRAAKKAKAKPKKARPKVKPKKVGKKAKAKPGKGRAKRKLRPTLKPKKGTPKARKKVASIIKALKAAYPDAGCELDHSNALELLVATILAAQCTDERVNRVTRHLFAKYPSPASFAAADLGILEKEVRPTGFFRNKAKNIKRTSQVIAEEHGGRVPETMEELLQLPGVARKTANVVLGAWFAVPSGIVVDTHVLRLTRLLGLTKQTDPVRMEAELMGLVPQKKWIRFGFLFSAHGRRTCIARRPNCEECPVARLCPSRST